MTRTRNAVGIPFARAADSSIKQSEEREVVAAAPASPASSSTTKTGAKIERAYRIAMEKPTDAIRSSLRPEIMGA